MKRLAILFAFLAITATASASNVTVVATNFSDYGKGMVCVVDPSINGQFQNLFHASDFNTDRTSRTSAAKLLGFFTDGKNAINGDCYSLPASGTGTVPIPDRDDVYVVTILVANDGSKAYWNITD